MKADRLYVTNQPELRILLPQTLTGLDAPTHVRIEFQLMNVHPNITKAFGCMHRACDFPLIILNMKTQTKIKKGKNLILKILLTQYQQRGSVVFTLRCTLRSSLLTL